MKANPLFVKVCAVLLVLSLLLGNNALVSKVFAAAAPISNIPQWPTSHNNGGVDGEVYIDQLQAFTGSAALKIVNRTPKADNVYLAIRQYVAVKPNTDYQVSMMVKGEAVTRAFAILDTNWNTKKPIPNGTYEWQPFSFTITTGPSVTSPLPFVILSDGLTSALWIDDITIKETGTTDNLLQNGDFETMAAVEAVAANVPSGAVAAGTPVILSTTTVSAAVYYTVDNSDPKTSSTKQLYTAPVMIEPPMVLKAYAEKTGYASSPVSTYSYTVPLGAGETHIGQSEFFANLAAGKAVPVYYTPGSSVVIDGNLEEWSGASYIRLPIEGGTLPANLANWGGAEDLSGQVYFSYNDQYLYFAARVTDNSHAASPGSAMWSGDSIQFASGTTTLFGPEYGFAQVDDQPEVWSWSQGAAVLDKDAIQLRTQRTGNETVYEAAIPWQALQAEAPGPGQAIPFNLLLNDNDGSGRKNWVEWTPGIGKLKDQFAFGNLFLVPEGSSWGLWLDRDYALPEDNRYLAEQNQLMSYSMYLVNSSDVQKEFAARVPLLDIEWDGLAVPAHTVLRKQFSASFAQPGQRTLSVEVTEPASGVRQIAEWAVNVLSDGTELLAELERLQADLPALKALRDQVKGQGLAVDYEDVDIAVLEKFIPYGKEDVAEKQVDRAKYVTEQLGLLYQQTKVRLEGYLAGTQTPFAVPRYVTGDVLLDHYSFIGNTIDPVTGEAQTGPVFFTGYGHFAQIRKDVPVMSSFGANILQIESGPNRVLLPPGTLAGWSKGIVGSADAAFQYETEDVQEGAMALKITNRTPKAPNVYGSVWQTITVKPNTEYTMSVWAKGDNVNHAWFGTFTNRQYLPTGTYGWQQVTKTYMTGPQETSVAFRIATENVTDSLLIDSVSFAESGTDVNLAAYPGFEDADTIVKEDYLISTASIRNDIQQVLQSAADHNQAVSLLLSPHNFPASLLEKYPDMKSKNSGFIKFNINHPKAKEAVEDYLRTLIPMVKDYPSLHNLVISNEPVYVSYKDAANAPSWHHYLAELYSDIGQLNETYGTHYTSFDEVAMPATEERTPLFYDWICFNDGMFAEWHQWMADLIHEMAPGIPLSAKIMGGALSQAQLAKSPLSWGVDPEQISALSQLNGLDAWSYLYDQGVAIEKLKFYDLLASYKQAPIFNSEDHIIPDRDSRFVPEQVFHVRNDLWQGAVHGRSASTIWVWERTDDPASDLAGSVLYRPDVVSAIGKTGLDLNRLAYEVTAFQNAPVETVILYSKASSMYRPAHLDAVDRAYTALSYAGQKVGFISEKQIQEGKLSSSKLLIVPDARYVDAETLSGIKSYIEQGGSVVILGEESLQRDPHNVELAPDVRSYVMSHSMVIPVVGNADNLTSPATADLRQQLLPLLRTQGLVQVELADAATGQLVYDVEWRVAEHEGRLLLNAANYSWSPKQVNVLLNGQSVPSAQELIQGKSVAATQLTLPPFTPLLLDLGIDTDTDTETGNQTETETGGQTETEPEPEPEAPGGNSGAELNPQSSDDHQEDIQLLPDISRHWAEASIREAVVRGLAEGYEDAAFRPDRPVTREEFITLLVRALKPAASGSIPVFTDAPTISGWAQNAVAIAAQAGWVTGYEDGTIRPGEPISRAEMTVLLMRAAGGAAETGRESDWFFTDDAAIPAWAREAIYEATAAGLLQGSDGGRFLPGEPATRAEAIVVLLRLLALRG